jgi:hypothetical protein
MFAEIANTASQHDWLTILCAIGSTAISGVMMIVMLANKSQKREVSFSFEPASKKEFDEARSKRDQEMKDMMSLIDRNRESAERQRSITTAGIYNKMDSVRSELEGRIDDVRKELSEDIKCVPDRVITTLKNTNAI